MLFLVLLMIGVGWFVSASPTSAQFDPIINRGATVSATMPDIVPPTTPILISPEDGSLLTTARPEFVWQESTDNVQMSHYQLHIDGELALDNLATVGDYEQYELSYDPVLGHYFLDIKFSLDQGDHTWKIVAVDAVGLTSESATWSFLIDTVAPYFVLTEIGGLTVSISAQDLDTIPEEPIALDVNEPILKARGEANSLVQLTVIIPGQDNYYSESQIDSRGHWSYRLPILPRDTVITLNFVIIDEARHITALEGVQIIIPSEKILLPKASATPTPDPLLTPVEPQPTTAPIVPLDPIEIPYRPPKEIVYEAFRRLTPTPVWKLTRTPWFARLMRLFGPWSVLLAISWPVIFATILLSKKFGSLLSPSHIKQIWRALGLLPGVEHQGWAFDATRFNLFSGEPLPLNLGVPFAKLTAISQSEPEGFPPYYQTVICNHQGLYPGFSLPLKEYKIAVTHPDYRFPTQSLRGELVDVEEFYKAEELEVSMYRSGLSLQIPADNDLLATVDSNRRSELTKRAWSLLTKIEVWLAKVIIFKHLFVLANVMVASLIVMFWPSWMNVTLFCGYLLFGSYYWLRSSLLANVKGLVIDQDGNSVQNVLVRLVEADEGKKTVATLSDKNGRFNFYFKKGQYKLAAVMPNGLKPKTATSEQDDVIEVGSWLDQQRVVVGVKGLAN